MPSANAAALDLFSGLAAATGHQDYAKHGHDLFRALAGRLDKAYPSMSALLAAWQKLQHPLCILIIADDPTEPAAIDLARAAHHHPIFAAHILTLREDAHLPDTHPAHGKRCVNGAPSAYICRDQSCLPPITEPRALSEALDAMLAQRQTEALAAIDHTGEHNG